MRRRRATSKSKFSQSLKIQLRNIRYPTTQVKQIEPQLDVQNRSSHISIHLERPRHFCKYIHLLLTASALPERSSLHSLISQEPEHSWTLPSTPIPYISDFLPMWSGKLETTASILIAVALPCEHFFVKTTLLILSMTVSGNQTAKSSFQWAFMTLEPQGRLLSSYN